MLVLIGGGARSGKSRFALQRAELLGERRVFVATAEALDPEFEERIRRHQEERGEGFETIERPRGLPALLSELSERPEIEVVLIDCLTLWLSNLLVDDASEAEVLAELDALEAALQAAPFHCVLVTNEVGLGLVPNSALGRSFRDLAGRVHARLAAVSDEVYLGAMGLILRLRPDPVQTLSSSDFAQLPQPRG